MSSLPVLSIVIPAHNAAETLADCLDAVYSSTTPVQVIVVDDGSTDNTAQIAAQAHTGAPTGRRADESRSSTGPRCELIRTEINRGAAAARNLGARVARAPVLFFLDADIVMERDTVARILDEFDRDPSLAALFGSYQKDTVPQNFVSVYKNLLHHYTHQTSVEQAATFCGGYGAIRRQVFCALGGFDESYHALEDIELGYRLNRAGYSVRLVKTLQFTHLKQYTLGGLVRSDLVHRAIPWTRLMLDHRIFRNDLNTKSNNVASVAVCGLLLAAPLWVGLVPYGFALAAAFVVLFVLLNRGFIAFATRERGLWFGIQTAFMSWLNYVYSGLGLALGVGSYLLHNIKRGRA